MHDTELFQRATEASSEVMKWRRRARQAFAAGNDSERRTCLRYARRAETRVYNLSILAEVRCEREVRRHG